jgi:transcriptional regulator
MYQPAHFVESDTATLHGLIEQHPLATWVTCRPDGPDGEPVPEVNHVPFLLDRSRGSHGTLVGHVARANPVWRTPARSVLVFQGPAAYVSPGWYASKAAHGKVVPTWNYAVVHAHGTPRPIEDRAALLAIVSRLTDHHEGRRGLHWQVSDAPADYVEQMLAAIVGIELPIEALEGKWKVSQNRPGADRDGVRAGLGASEDPGERAMAALAGQHRRAG